jgi:hypothetical protein
MKTLMSDAHQKKSIRALLTGIIDYAGLFPPSQLSMPQAVANYAAYKNSNYKWMLGRFVVPVTRLDEFTQSAKDLFSGETESWHLSVLASDDIYRTVQQIEDFNAEYAPKAVADVLEVKAETSYQIKEIAEAVSHGLETYFEITLNENLADLISTLAIYGRKSGWAA